MPKKLLIVEDNARALESRKNLLENPEIEWLIAKTPEEAVQLAADNRDIAAVAVDCDLKSDVTSDQLIEAVKALVGDIPAIILDRQNLYWAETLMDKLARLDLVGN